MFHFLAQHCADAMIGANSRTRSNPAWRQVYRALDHGPAKKANDQRTINKFPIELQNFASLFAAMQEKRHLADYDPACQLKRSGVLNDINAADAAMKDFEKTPAKDKTAFCALVLFRPQKDP
jgi:hypothetical protein